MPSLLWAYMPPLFGQFPPSEEDIAHHASAAAVPPLHTYAVLCAAKVAGLRTMISDSGLQWGCLFKGEQEEKLKNWAPYLVELKEGNEFTRRLFTHLPNRPKDDFSAHL